MRLFTWFVFWLVMIPLRKYASRPPLLSLGSKVLCDFYPGIEFTREETFYFLYPSFSELVFWWFHKLFLCRVLHIVDAFETKFWESNPTKEYDILKERKGKERKKRIEITNSLR